MLRTSLRPQALHTMGELLYTKNESVKFKAAEYLDGLNRGSHTVGATQANVQINNSNTVSVTPGYAIDLRPDDAPQIRCNFLRRWCNATNAVNTSFCCP